GVTVEFHPEPGTPGPRSTSETTDEAGRYRLHSTRGGDGAVVGSHRVCVLDTHSAGRRFALLFRGRLPKEAGNSRGGLGKLAGLPEEGLGSPPWPPRYGRPNETPLRAEVRPGAQVIDLELKREGKLR